MRPSSASAVVLVTTALAGAVTACGTSERDRVRAKVQQFLDGTRRHDYHLLCDQVLSPVLIEHVVAAGLQCESALRIALGDLQNPTLLVGRVTVQGRTASVITLTGAKGQRASLDAVQLRRTDAGWRLVSLGAPVTSTKPR